MFNYNSKININMKFFEQEQGSTNYNEIYTEEGQ